MHLLPTHPPLLGPGASLTDARATYHRQLRALQTAQDMLPDELRDGGTFAPRALVHAIVAAYLDAMRAEDPDEDPTVWLADGPGACGAVLFAAEGDARAYCEAHSLVAPMPRIVATRETAAELTGETA